MFYAHALKSNKSGRFYAGSTKDLRKSPRGFPVSNGMNARRTGVRENCSFPRGGEQRATRGEPVEPSERLNPRGSQNEDTSSACCEVLHCYNETMFKHPFFVFLFVMLVVLVVINNTALRHFWYWSYPWFDIVTHFMGGFWVGGMLLWFLFLSGKKVDNAVRTRTLFIKTAVFVLVVALFWDGIEYGIGAVSIIQKGYFSDTIGDLFVGVAASIVVTSVFLLKKYHIQKITAS